MGNFYINRYNKINTQLSLSDYWDFSLSNEKYSSKIPDGTSIFDDCVISSFDFNDLSCFSGNTIYSLSGYTWSGSTNNGYTLSDIGFTGIDNGLIQFDVNNTSDVDFFNLITGSTISNQNTGDARLFLTSVTGNTQNFIYPTSIQTDVNNINSIRLDGGFYQGFFKINDDYSILPTVVNKEISYEFVLTPDFSSTPQTNTLNEKYPNNKGFFFYLGLRSENKFWYDYNKEDQTNFQIKSTGATYPTIPTGLTLTTSTDFDTKLQNVWEVETDNKHILFNRLSSGNTVSGFDESKTYYLTGKTVDSPNYFLYADQTSSGYTVDYHYTPNTGDTSTCNGGVLRDLDSENTYYSISNDLINNVIGFRIKDDGSIGYRTITKNCNNNTEFDISEEYSQTGVTIDGNKTMITIRMVMSDYSKCGNSKRTYKLYFYVDSKLIFTSKELPELFFKELDELKEKQGTIPFNISIGGGSQGLCDMIGFNENYFTQYLLPIEENFAGSFIGNIDGFKIYNCKYDYSKIKNNFYYQFNPPFNSNYIPPTIDLVLSGVTLQNYESTYIREKGNIDSIIGGNITLNKPNGGVYSLLTGYKLYFSVDNSNQIQINGLFSVNPYGGLLSGYTHNDNSVSGATTLKYTIEVFDTKNPSIGNKQSKTIIFDNMIFYGTSNITPTGTTEVRNLTNKVFNTNTNTITLQTGTIDKTFSVAVPENKTIISVFDQNAMYVDLTNNYVLNQILVEDAGGNASLYNVYTMRNAIPYSSSHNHIITFSN